MGEEEGEACARARTQVCMRIPAGDVWAVSLCFLTESDLAVWCATHAGVPALAVVAVLFVIILYYLIFKVKRYGELSRDNVRNIRALLKARVTTPARPSRQ